MPSCISAGTHELFDVSIIVFVGQLLPLWLEGMSPSLDRTDWPIKALPPPPPPPLLLFELT